MGYNLEAIICKDGLSNIITSEYKSAKRISLKNNLFIIPYTEELYDELNQYKKSEDYNGFFLLNEKLFRYLLIKSVVEPIAYIEVDYFGGVGQQSAIMLDKEEIILDTTAGKSEDGAVNLVLKEFGIKREQSLDEWDTVEMLRHRHTEDWLEDAEG